MEQGILLATPFSHFPVPDVVAPTHNPQCFDLIHIISAHYSLIRNTKMACFIMEELTRAQRQIPPFAINPSLKSRFRDNWATICEVL